MEHLSLLCIHSKKEDSHAFWPMQAVVFWADVFMLPWKMLMAPWPIHSKRLQLPLIRLLSQGSIR
jgi:hypothetical protein